MTTYFAPHRECLASGNPTPADQQTHSPSPDSFTASEGNAVIGCHLIAMAMAGYAFADVNKQITGG